MNKPPVAPTERDTTTADRVAGTPGGPGLSPAPTPRRAFGRTYWMLNSIEMFERLAYFGIRAVVPIYIMQATEPGGLHMTALHKGWIYAWWAILQSWLPMFTGGIADRYGYKRVLAGAIGVNVVGYLMMAYLQSYHGFFAGILVLATGTAFFKPALQGSIAQGLTKRDASMGWGIFYWVVNIGAMLAPVLATLILGKPHSADGWKNLFLVSAGYTACNLLLLLTFRDVPSGADKSHSLLKVFAVTIENIWPYWHVGGRFHPPRGVPGLLLAVVGLVLVIVGPVGPFKWLGLGEHQWILGVGLLIVGMWLAAWLRGGTFTWQLRLPAFLLIMSCFWMMMYQLWDLHPNFVEDWVDSESVTQYVPFDSWREYGDRGLLRVPQQIVLTFYNAFLIILLVIPVSYFVRKMRTLSAMLIGMSVATAGVLVAGLTSSGWILILGVTFFSFGEMLTGPKKNQYLGLIAPPGKKGLYLGYVNIPVGVGVGLGSLIAGVVYNNFGEKAGLALKELGTRTELMARAAQSADWSDSLEKIPPLLKIDRGAAFDVVRAEMGVDESTAAENLREHFEYDQGQIDNLALLYIAVQTDYETDKDYRSETAEGLARILSEDQDDEEFKKLGAELASGEKTIDQIGLARFVHWLPDAIDKERVVAFEWVREELVNKDLPADEARQDAEIIDMLWRRFGDDPEVLNNLTLEYLAQSTNLVRDAIAGLTFEHSPDELDQRIEEIDEHIGIGRTKSFAALSAARGADAADVDGRLAALNVAGTGRYDRVYAYLIVQPHIRFIAVAKKDWSKDLDLLREMIRHDEKALQTVLAEIDHDTLSESILATIKGIFGPDAHEGEMTEEGVNYTRLAGKQDLLIKALDAKDWTRTPELIPPLLRLNPSEARFLAAAEVNKSPLVTTRLLWNKYHPQYKVWITFAAIGVLAAIALAVFGQKAKKWADMNA
ncbi:MAG: MFS transporter [Phycisphaerae bacterium]|nr:MFS transporter [Phycisphaerae bacterium]